MIAHLKNLIAKNQTEKLIQFIQQKPQVLDHQDEMALQDYS